MNIHIPNALTLFRGLAAFVIVALFFSPFSDKYLYAYILFILAAASDYLDGFLARRWNMTSDFGAVFDPLFDKVLVLTLLFLLYPLSVIHPLILLVLFVRDITVETMKGFMLARGIVTPAIHTAKVKTTLQLLMLHFALLALAFPMVPFATPAAMTFGVFAVLFSLWSGGIYVRQFSNSINK